MYNVHTKNLGMIISNVLQVIGNLYVSFFVSQLRSNYTRTMTVKAIVHSTSQEEIRSAEKEPTSHSTKVKESRCFYSQVGPK